MTEVSFYSHFPQTDVIDPIDDDIIHHKEQTKWEAFLEKR
jgi:hypothetical protein